MIQNYEKGKDLHILEIKTHKEFGSEMYVQLKIKYLDHSYLLP